MKAICSTDHKPLAPELEVMIRTACNNYPRCLYNVVSAGCVLSLKVKRDIK